MGTFNGGELGVIKGMMGDEKTCQGWPWRQGGRPMPGGKKWAKKKKKNEAVEIGQDNK